MTFTCLKQDASSESDEEATADIAVARKKAVKKPVKAPIASGKAGNNESEKNARSQKAPKAAKATKKGGKTRKGM